MNRKLIAILMGTTALLALSACGDNAPKEEVQKPAETPAEATSQTPDDPIFSVGVPGKFVWSPAGFDFKIEKNGKQTLAVKLVNDGEQKISIKKIQHSFSSTTAGIQLGGDCIEGFEAQASESCEFVVEYEDKSGRDIAGNISILTDSPDQFSLNIPVNVTINQAEQIAPLFPKGVIGIIQNDPKNSLYYNPFSDPNSEHYDPSHPAYDPRLDPTSDLYDPTLDVNSSQFDPSRFNEVFAREIFEKKGKNNPFYNPYSDPDSPLYDKNHPLYDARLDRTSPRYDPRLDPMSDKFDPEFALAQAKARGLLTPHNPTAQEPNPFYNKYSDPFNKAYNPDHPSYDAALDPNKTGDRADAWKHSPYYNPYSDPNSPLYDPSHRLYDPRLDSSHDLYDARLDITSNRFDSRYFKETMLGDEKQFDDIWSVLDPTNDLYDPGLNPKSPSFDLNKAVSKFGTDPRVLKGSPVYDPRLDPESPLYDPNYAAKVFGTGDKDPRYVEGSPIYNPDQINSNDPRLDPTSDKFDIRYADKVLGKEAVDALLRMAGLDPDEVRRNARPRRYTAADVSPEMLAWVQSMNGTPAAPRKGFNTMNGSQNALHRNASTFTRYNDDRYDPETIPWTETSLPVDRSRILTTDRVIKAVMETPVTNVVCNKVVAVIESNVYSPNGPNVLIPAGSRAIGRCNTFIDERVNVAWERILTPNGTNIVFKNLTADTADAMGRGGAVGIKRENMFDKYVLPLAKTTFEGIASIARAIVSDRTTTTTDVDTNTVTQENDPTGEAIRDFADNSRDQIGEYIDDIQDLRSYVIVPTGSRIDIVLNEDVYFKTPHEVVRLADVEYDLKKNPKTPELIEAQAPSVIIEPAINKQPGQQTITINGRTWVLQPSSAGGFSSGQ